MESEIEFQFSLLGKWNQIEFPSQSSCQSDERTNNCNREEHRVPSEAGHAEEENEM
jgi:hypothetical protein